MKNSALIKFDWEHRWLKGEEYAHILNNMDSYCQNYQMLKFEQKTHPESIYTDPESKFFLFWILKRNLSAIII